MTSEGLSLAQNPELKIDSFINGTVNGQAIVWDGTLSEWRMKIPDVIASPTVINPAEVAFNPASPAPATNTGYLYKKSSDSGLYWYPNGGAEINLVTGSSDPQLLGNGTASAPSYSFTASTTTGIYSPATNKISITANNAERLRVDASGNVYIGAGADAAITSILELSGTTKGFLPPRLTHTQKTAIASPATGLTVFDTDRAALSAYSTNWYFYRPFLYATVNTTDATVTTLFTNAVASNTAWFFKLYVVAVRTSATAASQAMAFEVSGCYRNQGGTVSIVGTLTKNFFKDDATTDVTASISGTDVLLRVTGAAGVNYTWNGRLTNQVA